MTDSKSHKSRIPHWGWLLLCLCLCIVIVCLALIGYVYQKPLGHQEPLRHNYSAEKAPTKLTLYSINFRVVHGRVPPEVDQIQGYPILGKIEVESEADRGRIFHAMKEGIAKGPKPDDLPLCFFPRHAIRATTAKETADFIICFECSGIWKVREDGLETGLTTAGFPKEFFDKYLTDAGIPLCE